MYISHKVRIGLIGLIICFGIVACKSKKPVQQAIFVSYVETIRPIMVRSCDPCHFPERGKKSMLDTYERTKESIDDIIRRVSLAPENKDFMPWKQKRQTLTVEEIELFKEWVKAGMPE